MLCIVVSYNNALQLRLASYHYELSYTSTYPVKLGSHGSEIDFTCCGTPDLTSGSVGAGSPLLCRQM